MTFGGGMATLKRELGQKEEEMVAPERGLWSRELATGIYRSWAGCGHCREGPVIEHDNRIKEDGRPGAGGRYRPVTLIPSFLP